MQMGLLGIYMRIADDFHSLSLVAMSPHWLAVGLLVTASLGQALPNMRKDATYLPPIITEGPDILYSERSADKDRNVENNRAEHLTGNHHGDEGDDILLTEEQLAAANLSRLEGEELLEKLGDTMLTPEQLAAILNRKAIDDVTKLWPDVNGFPEFLIPLRRVWSLNDSPDLVDKAIVRGAIQHWTSNTCLTFTEVPNTSTGERIKFIRHASSCNSYVGMVSGSEGQIINVPVWCELWFSDLVHIVGHALGLLHEQSRSDRDAHVLILPQNIRSAELHNFNLMTTNNYGVPYDYSSIMHYDAQAFSLNSRNTIVTKDPRFQAEIGQREGLSHMDKLIVNTMYGCTDKLLISCGLVSDPCQNNGYLGSDCTCVCPDGTSGSNCETVDTLYNDAILHFNTEVVTVEKNISTVNYPDVFPLGKYCYTVSVHYSLAIAFFFFFFFFFVPGWEPLFGFKWIIAPVCNEVKLTFTAFDVYTEAIQTIDGVNTLGCWRDALEIRTTAATEGQWFCGTDISPGQEFQSVGGEMILYFKVGTFFKTGWSADITFVPIPSCVPSETTTTTTTSTSTSTSTTTTTSTSTSSTTTTTALVGQCTSYTENGRTYFISPNFPEYYPPNAHCTLSGITEELATVNLFIRVLRLRAGDTLVIQNPYTPPLTLSGKKRRYRNIIPSATIPRYFHANASERGRVSITLNQKLPLPPRKASVGNKVQLTFTHMRLGTYAKNFVAVNPTTDLYYTPGSVLSFNGFALPPNVISDSNLMRIFFSGKRRSRGFRLLYNERAKVASGNARASTDMEVMNACRGHTKDMGSAGVNAKEK
ncbi:blastula protease 10-like [Penaeus monodon]|uniref:blastula protease 10-like n=1 Tax=Penaeus monodon TaxID=6687 RepID=UPI0018A77EDD|nr:blastula protease 10-like [Penaeus monodon]